MKIKTSRFILLSVLFALLLCAGVIAHKDCETCGKHFDASGAELTDLTIEKLPAVEKKVPLSSGAIMGITVAVTICCISVAETLAYIIYKKNKSKK